MTTAHLTNRRLLRVAGADAAGFLQNVITNDMDRLAPGKLLYACLLTPQGQFLHDFFIFPDGEGFVLDTEAARTDDLLRRFNIFKLRAKVSFGDVPDLKVYAAASHPKGLADPRREDLGMRVYSAETVEAGPAAAYDDFCISKTVPCGSLTIKTERDTMADVNLDLLNAVAWDKGCFIGQEVAARMYHRNIAKRRLFTVTGQGLQAGQLNRGDVEVGEIRQVNSARDAALAVINVAALEQGDAGIADGGGGPVAVIGKHEKVVLGSETQ